MGIAKRLSIPLMLLMASLGSARALGEPPPLVDRALGRQGDAEEAFVVIQAGRVITLGSADRRGGPCEEIIDGQIVIVDGKIRLVGKDLDYPKSAKLIDARDEVVMPGMIHPRTRWQLPSLSRSGVHGDRTAESELYLQEIDFEPLLQAGFTAICYYPPGTGIPGSGVVYRTAGDKDKQKLGSAYLRITMSSPGRDKKGLIDAVAKARKEIEKVEKARKEWEEKQKKAKEEAAKKAAAEKAAADKGEKPTPEKKEEPPEKKDDEQKDDGKDEEKKDDTPEKKDDKAKPGEKKPEEKKPETFTPPKIDPAVLPLVNWIRDKKGLPLLFEISRASDLHHLDDALKRAKELPGTMLYLSGSYSPDFHHVVEDLGERKALVLALPRVGQLPYTIVRYNLPAELVLAGCTVAMLPSSDSTSELPRLRSRLAELVRAGMPRDDALKAVTLNAAKVLGMDDRLGSIEKGKDADVIFLDGDPLGTETRVTRVMTFGEIVWEASEKP